MRWMTPLLPMMWILYTAWLFFCVTYRCPSESVQHPSTSTRRASPALRDTHTHTPGKAGEVHKWYETSGQFPLLAPRPHTRWGLARARRRHRRRTHAHMPTATCVHPLVKLHRRAQCSISPYNRMRSNTVPAPVTLIFSAVPSALTRRMPPVSMTKRALLVVSSATAKDVLKAVDGMWPWRRCMLRSGGRQTKITQFQ